MTEEAFRFYIKAGLSIDFDSGAALIWTMLIHVVYSILFIQANTHYVPCVWHMLFVSLMMSLSYDVTNVDDKTSSSDFVYMLSIYLLTILPADAIAFNGTRSPTGTMLIAKLHMFFASLLWLAWFLSLFRCHNYVTQNGLRNQTEVIDTSIFKWHTLHVLCGERNIDLPIRPCERNRWQDFLRRLRFQPWSFNVVPNQF